MPDIKKLNKDTKVVLKDHESGTTKTFIKRKYRLKNGLVETWFVDAGKDSVQVIAVTTNNKVILTKQFRPGVEKYVLELPGGGMEPGETSQEAGKRELLEETGFGSSKSFELLMSQGYSPWSTGIRHSLFMDGVTIQSDKQDLDPNEDVEVVLVTKAELDRLIETGSLRGFEAWLFAKHKGLV